MIKKFIRKILGVSNPTESGQANRKPTVLSAKEHGINPQLVSANALRVTQTLQDNGYKAFVVGGAVRDLLTGVKPKDFDIATNATPEQVKRLFRRAFIIGRRFQIVHVMFGQDLLEVTTFRGPSNEAAPKDEHGRVLRDNTFGEQHDDAVRRDFTVNAMYYDPATETVLDYHGGMKDIRKKVLRIIGVAEARYREDPVRMLRVVRFAAKLQFSIDAATRAPIAVMAPLINNVPAARVFDEMLKLLTSGHAMACLQQLRKEGLHHGLMPLLDVVLEQPHGEKFVTLALANTDERVLQGKPVSPSFLFAALLWHQVVEKWDAYKAAGEFSIPALHLAADDVLNTQTDALAIQRKVGADMRDIWAMQPRFEKRIGKTPYKVLEHPRLRAGYDFLLLRCACGEIEAEIGTWWTDFINGNEDQREQLIQSKPKTPAAAGPAKKRKPRRRSPAASTPAE
ncbi:MULTISPECIES: polynucleotide adenylyltransferase PcnB [unclassified Undibacterium]|uniref:polynucleotide adenylyltransferase PcnB n=1 Tax=unclassified Undibacterium TaxID=2630295 RepID=UPI002AC9BDE7|nr:MULTISPECIES: polynucleotide adenylyltransferase PcnB [unclassified Undibacterium]MEB0139920.1 polynucleotide adenylyltransferase PcnB [Undibacterium sp. CCC2.1]MEB0171811.1 polynucleotide adenylyltransferase PcnB [Undibacterium sp. CCC1.1]MEB0175627.1 polynucleotide adenylyltransferase PcnB [Undibacterium sp. CCC3.4]MEB0216209.1 polynucleotide adenylyltransferase PcnB [Undibacterium sp. 5I2]WPX44102.1 polynucleotide adenylyltransferase PcnB [Undibacterium sp. CCC3.4]